MPETRQTGVVAKWLNHKGIGFITPQGAEEGASDILVHYGQIKQDTKDGFRSLEQGSMVEYDLKEDPKNPEKCIAVNVTGQDGADCVAKTRREYTGDAPKGKGKKGKGKGKKGKGKGRKGKGKGAKKEESEEAKEEADEE